MNLHLRGPRYCFPASAAAAAYLSSWLVSNWGMTQKLTKEGCDKILKSHLARKDRWLIDCVIRIKGICLMILAKDAFFLFSDPHWQPAASTSAFPPFGCLCLFPLELAIDWSVGHCTSSPLPLPPFLSLPSCPTSSSSHFFRLPARRLPLPHRLCNLAVVA